MKWRNNSFLNTINKKSAVGAALKKLNKKNKIMENEIIKIETEATPSALLQLAIQQNLDIEKLERLMQLQERWEAAQSRKEFLTAVSKFQAQCPALEKTKKVEFTNKAGYKTKYSYAPLGEIVASIKAAMSNNGLSYRWELEDTADKIICTCIVSHLTGHSEKTTMGAAKDESGSKNDIQQRGSSITYLQRYTLIAALGISTADEDVDGHKEEEKTKVETKPPVYPPVTEKKTNGLAKQPEIIPDDEQHIIDQWLQKINESKTTDELKRVYSEGKTMINNTPVLFSAKESRKKELATT